MNWQGCDLRRVEKLVRAASTGQLTSRRARRIVRIGFYASVRFRLNSAAMGGREVTQRRKGAKGSALVRAYPMGEWRFVGIRFFFAPLRLCLTSHRRFLDNSQLRIRVIKSCPNPQSSTPSFKPTCLRCSDCRFNILPAALRGAAPVFGCPGTASPRRASDLRTPPRISCRPSCRNS